MARARGPPARAASSGWTQAGLARARDGLEVAAPAGWLALGRRARDRLKSGCPGAGAPRRSGKPSRSCRDERASVPVPGPERRGVARQAAQSRAVRPGPQLAVERPVSGRRAGARSSAPVGRGCQNVRMSRPVDALDASFPVAASIALDLIRRPEVTEQWSSPSALPHLSVGGLACHLGRQAVRAAELLPMPTDLPVLESADNHYERAAWVTEGSPDKDSVASGPDEADAARGPADLHARSAQALEEVGDLLSRGAARDVVPIPWQGWALRRSDVPAHPSAGDRGPLRRPRGERRRAHAGVPGGRLRPRTRPAASDWPCAAAASPR